MSGSNYISGAFFQQVEATAEQMKKIAKLKPLLWDLYRLHRRMSSIHSEPVTAVEHRDLASRLQEFLE